MDSLLQSADLVVGNFEGAVGDSANRLKSTSGSPVFDISKSSIPILSKAGFKVLSVENNHSFDLGEIGKETTINSLLQSNISPLYYNNSPQFFKLHGLIVAIIAINQIPGRDNKCQEIPSVEIRQKLRLAKSLSNMVVVYIHWGSELLEWPNRYQRTAAKWLVNNGADIIIGCHPHVIQEPEMIDGKPVFFSLGNHLFDQKYPGTKEGLIVDCRISNGKFKCTGIITKTSKNSFFPETAGVKNFKLHTVQLSKSLQIGDVSIQPISTSVLNQNKIILEAFQNGKKLWQTYPMSIASITTNKLDGKNDFLITLEKHYSNIDNAISLRPYVYTIDRNGLVAKWRGSALSWPLLDAIISPDDKHLLCALHRGDSFIDLNTNTKNIRIAVYRWNGFGFSGVNDSMAYKSSRKYFNN
jgi:hypothetical protein